MSIYLCVSLLNYHLFLLKFFFFFGLCGPFLFWKVLIEFFTVLLKICGLVFWPWGMRDLTSLTRDRTYTLCFGRWSLNQWTSREVPVICLSFYPFISLFQNGLETYTNTYNHKCACTYTHTHTCTVSLFCGKDWQMIGIYTGIEIRLEDYTHINVNWCYFSMMGLQIVFIFFLSFSTF